MVMLVVMMVVVVYYHYNLRLCRIGYRETEGEGESEQNFFHSLVSRLVNPFTEQL
jgi:hypothetical protein